MVPGRPDDHDNSLHINLEMKTKRMTLVQLLSFKGWIILFSIWLFVFSGYLDTFGANRIYFCKNPSTYRHFDQQSIVYTSERIVRGWVKTGYKEKVIIEMAGKFGLRKKFSKSEAIPIIIFVFIGGWGIAILFVLGVILYQIIIEPLIKKKRLRRSEMR